MTVASFRQSECVAGLLQGGVRQKLMMLGLTAFETTHCILRSRDAPARILARAA